MSSAADPKQALQQPVMPETIVHTVAELEAMIESHGVSRQPPMPATADSVVGEIVDTHHPHRPGRVCVRWRDVDAVEHEHWLVYNAGIKPAKGRLVVLSRPSNWREWLVTSMLTQGPASEASPSQASEASQPGASAPVLRLEECDALRVETAQGKLMFELAQEGEQPVLRVGQDLTIALDGTFRVEAGRVEVRSGPQGTDLRSEGPTLIRGTQVRVN